MKISGAIQRLEAIKKVEGDILIAAHDGMDPSDLGEADTIEVRHDLVYANDGCFKRKFVAIRP